MREFWDPEDAGLFMSRSVTLRLENSTPPWATETTSRRFKRFGPREIITRAVVVCARRGDGEAQTCRKLRQTGKLTRNGPELLGPFALNPRAVVVCARRSHIGAQSARVHMPGTPRSEPDPFA